MIGETQFNNALCDLGASVNLMPFSLFEKLGFEDVKPKTISLQLAARSIVYPRGIIEDMLIKVKHFIFPVDFIVLDMEEDRNIPLILGRPFLRTARTIIDVAKGKLIMRLGEEQIEFQFVNSMKFPLEVDCCYRIDEIENAMDDSVSNHIDDDPLKTCLTNVIMKEDETINEEVQEVVNDLNSLPISEQQTSQELIREEKIDDGKEE